MSTRILLVEDNELNRDMLSRRLTRRGYEVMVAIDGADAVEAVKRDRPDIVLMDLSLPVMDGLEATRTIRADAQIRMTPIIALTAHALERDRHAAMEVGCNAFETKPLNLNQLLGKIEALIAA
jgi:CheY-like chemotaxis protein